MTGYAVKHSIRAEDIRILRKKLKLTQKDFAKLVNVSQKTIERWESENRDITGPVTTLVHILNEYPQIEENLRVPEKEYPIRLWYMFKSEICTIIDVDERGRKVKIYNYTNNFIKKAFGRNEKPTFEEYEEFLESRCFPRQRDKIKLVLEDLNLPFYDPFMIIEKTEGRMAEDDFWISATRSQTVKSLCTSNGFPLFGELVV